MRPTRSRLPPFFSNLLPEGTLREYLARRAHLNATHEFDLLCLLGQDLPGAIQIRPSQTAGREEPLELSAQADVYSGPLRFSLAGVQLKFSAIERKGGRLTIAADGLGGSWIVKLPSPLYRRVPENEFTMMELARKVGIEVPQTKLIPLKEIEGVPREFLGVETNAFAIKRFDRNPLQEESIHIEDFAQVFGVYPEEKYRVASYRNIAEVVWSELGEKGLREFIGRFVFNLLIGNGDMHLKNWSLIYRDRKNPELAPAYDFVSTIPYISQDSLALKFMDTRQFSEVTRERILRFCTKCEIPADLFSKVLEQTVSAFMQAWKSISEYPLDKETGQVIDSHLKTLQIF